MMKADTLSDAERKSYLETIFRSTERLKNLVEELFELSKLEARESKPAPNLFQLLN